MNEPNSDLPAPLPVANPALALAPTATAREQVVERLTRAFADDAITMDEFERRAELVYSAASVSALQALVADLPAPVEQAAVRPKGRNSNAVAVGDRISTLLGSTERRMPATIPRYLTVRTMLGNTELDFRHSKFEPGITEVNVKCFMGSVEITVPDGVRVELLCSAVLANVGTGAGDDLDNSVGSMLDGGSDARVLPAASKPVSVLRVTGRAVFANVEVHQSGLGLDSSLT